MSIYNNKQELLDFLSIKENFLYGNFSNKFSKLILQKKSGGQRIINPPTKNLKRVQRTILDKILKKQEVLPCVYGLTAQRNIVENAKYHQKNAAGFILLLDIKDFFPSVKQHEVYRFYKKNGFSKENAKILTKVSTFNGCLPQGAPSSCHLASFCFETLDKEIYNYCRLRGLIYSRYIDDITISGKNITKKDVNNIEKLITKKGYELNDKKQFLLPHDDKIINNLFVSTEKILVTDHYKNDLVSLYSKLKQNENELNYAKFIGKLGFYIFVNRNEAYRFYRKLKSEAI